MIYFDNAATTFPKPQRVYDKMYEVMTQYAANPGRSGHKMALKMDREIYRAREAVCRFVHGNNPLQVIFTCNCTDSLNNAIKGGIPKGSHVVTTSMEHNSVIRPLMELESNRQIGLTRVAGNQLGLVSEQDIEKAITEETKAVIITHMSNLVGSIMDITAIGKLCRKKNLLFIVDAAQSIGKLDVNVETMGIDILCFPGHKGLMGPMGTGGMYIREGIEVHSLREGGTGSFSSDLRQPKIYPDRLESGTPNGPGIIAMAEGIAYIEEVGLEAIGDKENELRRYFVERLVDIPGAKLYGPLDDRQGGVVSMNLGDLDSSELAYLLSEEYDIYIRPGLHCTPLSHETIGTTKTGTARFSFGYFNHKGEIDKAVSAIQEIVKEIKK